MIKGAGYQGIGSFCSLMCLCVVAIPTSSMMAFKHEWGIAGLWAGYGASACLLTALYYLVLTCIDWKATATWASQNEDWSVSSETNEDNNYNSADQELK